MIIYTTEGDDEHTFKKYIFFDFTVLPYISDMKFPYKNIPLALQKQDKKTTREGE